jgi:hypothetical protein
MPSYTIKRAIDPVRLDLDWESGEWAAANALSVENFHSRSTDHRPRTLAKLLYDDTALNVFFRVEDHYVRCVHSKYQDPVCRDSCVEFFVQPTERPGYFNFEFNCGGTLLLFFIEDATRLSPSEFKKATKVAPEIAGRIHVAHSMPKIVEPELQQPTTWMLQYSIPFEVFESHVGPIKPVAGQSWRANFYKCGDQTSHPHWATWAPIEQLNFHQPQHFAPLHFE